MFFFTFSLLFFYHLLPAVGFAAAKAAADCTRADFPAEFIFGSGTSAYQYEGAAFDYGRAPSIWDTLLHSGRIHLGDGDVACDGYHKFEDDIRLMSEMGLEAFRFSISWSRLIPNGRGPVNPFGLRYYNNFIDELASHGIQPHVSLHHFDLPQALEDEYGGWLSEKIVEDFRAYAEVCFREFGDRVKFWTTVNEGNVFSIGGYSEGFTPPGRCSPSLGPGCVGNSSTEPYIAAHNILLAHSVAWKLYRDKFKATQKGAVGFNILGYGVLPWSDAEEDIVASKRAADFLTGWFFSPLVFGRYPDSVSERVRGRIPVISESESEELKGSFDFLGVNHYLTLLVKNDPNVVHDIGKWGFGDDVGISATLASGEGLRLPTNGYPVLPSGFVSLLEYIKDTYNNPPLYIHENGQWTERDGSLDDAARVEYLEAYIGATLGAIRNGSNVRGYMTWSFLDCYELLDGYRSSFGFYYVDLDDPQLKRYKKLSAAWYSDFLLGKP